MCIALALGLLSARKCPFGDQLDSGRVGPTTPEPTKSPQSHPGAVWAANLTFFQPRTPVRSSILKSLRRQTLNWSCTNGITTALKSLRLIGSCFFYFKYLVKAAYASASSSTFPGSAVSISSTKRRAMRSVSSIPLILA